MCLYLFISTIQRIIHNNYIRAKPSTLCDAVVEVEAPGFLLAYPQYDTCEHHGVRSPIWEMLC